MEKSNIDAYIIPSSDAHQSEYVAKHWKCRGWISGFTGSAGTVVVTKDKSGLWTDGRYFIQAKKELSESEIELFKIGQEGVPSHLDWITENLEEGSKVGFDNKVITASDFQKMSKKFIKSNIEIIGNVDLIDEIWTDRPSIPTTKGFYHETKYSGKTIEEKLNLVRNEMNKNKVNYYILSSLDSIAWLYNIRGEDVVNNPVLICYAVVSEDYAFIFINKEKISEDIENEFEKCNILIKDYDEIGTYLSEIEDGESILIDPRRNSAYIFESVSNKCDIIENNDIVNKLKSIKNYIEIKNLKNCHNKDNVAMVKFLF